MTVKNNTLGRDSIIDIASLLRDKDEKVSYKNTKRIAAESENANEYYQCFSEFVSLLSHKKSYVRTRAFILCCAQVKRDTDGTIRKNLPQMLLLFHDKKPTVVRRCLDAIKSVIEYHPE